jgi:zinc D-Ala-D-Ala carboxypeptidase
MSDKINWAKYAPEFAKSEFDCKHTGLNEMKPEFMDKLHQLRKDYGKPMKVTSGYRHPTHPVEARKTHSNGEHTQGMCCDIQCVTGADRFELVSLALMHGFTRIGIAKNFVHLGLGGRGLPNNVIWEYA